MEAAGEALSLLLTMRGLTLLVIGTVIGTIVAIIPGMGSPVALAVLIPVTFTMSPMEALMLLVPVIGAGGFAGSVTAILVGVPGDETNAATTLDGGELGRQGRAGEAIGASSTASALGALFGVGVLIAAIPAIRGIVLSVGPPEIFVVALLGVLMVGTISAGSGRLKGVISGLLGLAISLIGFNYALGGVRFTFGIGDLNQGIPIVPALIGLFAIPEVVMMLRPKTHATAGVTVVRGGVMRGVKATLSRPRLLMQSSLIGTGVGVVPGIGGSIICWISYYAAKRTSKEPELFGYGSIEGVIGPEASTDAKDGGQMMPLLALGIPGGVTTAILAGAFLLHGIQPGVTMFTSNLSVVYLIVFALIFSNVTTSAIGLATANQLVKINKVPAHVLAPLIVAVGAVGSFVASGSFYGIWMFMVFGGLGYLMVRGGYSRAAIVVGLILLPIVETNLHISLQSHRGQLDFLLRPGILILLGLAVIAYTIPIVWRIVRRRLVTPLGRGGDASATGTGTRAGERVVIEASQSGAGRSAGSVTRTVHGTEGDDTSVAVATRSGAAGSDVAVDGAGAAPDAAGPDRTVDAATQDKHRDAHSPVIELAVAVGAIAFAGLLLVETVGLPADQRLVPLVILPVLVVTGLIAIVSVVRTWRTSVRVTEFNRMDAVALGSVLLLPPLMYLLGVIAGISLWAGITIIGYAVRRGRGVRAILGLVVLTILFGLAIDLLVVQALDLRLPGGKLF